MSCLVGQSPQNHHRFSELIRISIMLEALVNDGDSLTGD